MAQPQSNVSLTAPGFAGINTQDSPLDMDHTFASVANNCVIDRFGRIASRRGFRFVTTNPQVLSGNPIVSMEEFNTATGSTWLFACGNDTIYIQQTVAPHELVALTVPVGYVIANNNWKIVPFNDFCYFVQAGHKPLVFDPATPTELVYWAEYPAGMEVASDWPNTAHAAFGRLWLGALDTDATVVLWSGLLNGQDWSGSGWGSLQTEEYWPSGYDDVTTIAAHNNFICFFGKRNILVYTTNSDVVNSLRLQDTIEGLGCIARDSIVGTGTDILFIDATGLRSLNRTIQEKSVPIGDVSMNVRVDFQNALRAELTDNIKSVFHVEDNFYACFLPTAMQSYVFDMWNPLPTGAARCTTWSELQPLCGSRTLDRQTYFGAAGGVYQYEGAQDVILDPADNVTEVTTSIPMSYYTHPLDFGSPANLIFPKQVDVTLFGGLEGVLGIEWAYDYSENFSRKEQDLVKLGAVTYWNEGGEWNTADEWTATAVNLNWLKYNIWGSGRNVKVGFTTDILGTPVSIQELNIQVLQGRLL